MMRHARTLLLTGLALLCGTHAASAGAPEARLVQERAGNRLELPGGNAFHHTDRPISALRTVDVRGQRLQIYLWEEELESGERQSFYAVGKNGSELLGRVRATSYVIRLRHESFDPLRNPLETVPPPLRARDSQRLFLVQFVAAPLPEFREDLAERGAKVLRFLADHTFLVEMPAGVRGRVTRLPYVRWVGAYHPLFRLEKPLRDAIEGRRDTLEPERYSILLGERGERRQRALARRIEQLGGTVELIEPGGLRLEATLTQDQLAEVLHLDEVQFVDRWGGPGEVDLNLVREVGGADFVESVAGFTGQGVRGEIFDTELLPSHQEWASAPILHSATSSDCSPFLHGTSCFSNNFARGIDADSRGVIPDGQGIFFCHAESTQFGGTKSRFDANAELIDPAGPYRAVFQTSSVGSTRTTNYTTLSAETDDYLFRHQILSTQSQSNAGSRMSRPQAWAKNIVSVGGIRHLNTADRCDDSWSSRASIGPASDGRIKPDLAFFNDSIRSASGAGDTSYTIFGGTSSATPQTAGYFGLLFQMWHEGVWAGHGGGVDVFDRRPKMATAKALMINHAFRYEWTNPGACSFGDIDRFKQGWGTADAQRLFDRAPVTSVIDENVALAPLETLSFVATVKSGESELNVTMVYTDPMGTVGAAQHRVNDLSLRVTSPSGTSYWGNHGLLSGNVSIPGGSSNTVDTVENVLIRDPEAGAWTVEIFADEVVEDAHLETAEIDADFALVVSGGLISDTCTGEASLFTARHQVLGDGAGVHAYPTLTGDVNGDAKTDLIFVGQNWSGTGLNIRTQLSNGDGTWTARSQVLGDGAGVHAYPTLTGDVNGDDRTDLIFVGQNWNGPGLNIRTKLSNGDGTWTARSQVLGDGAGVHAYPAFAGDVDGDTKTDLIFVGQNWNGPGLNIRTKLSNGDGTWTARSQVLGDGVGVHAYPAFAGDVDGDTRTDLVFVGQNWDGPGLNLRTKLSNGDGTWAARGQVLGDRSDVHLRPALTGDTNGDRLMDLVFVGQDWCGGGLNVRVKESAGDGTWISRYEVLGDGPGVHAYPALTGTVDDGNRTDLLFVGQDWSGIGLNVRTKLSR